MITMTITSWIGLMMAGFLIVAVCGYMNDKAKAEEIKRIVEYMKLYEQHMENLDKNVQKMIDE